MHRLASLSTTQRLLLGGAVVVAGVAVLVVVLLLLGSTDTDAAGGQPIAFNHSAHAANGIACQFCHYGVTKGPVAVIPSVQKCMGCHQYVATDNPEIQKLTEYWQNEKPVEWVRVNRQPSYVYFPHFSHIAAGVNCAACHGDVAGMTVAEPVHDMNMGFCLGCHRDQEEEDYLIDCLTCHH